MKSDSVIFYVLNVAILYCLKQDWEADNVHEVISEAIYKRHRH